MKILVLNASPKGKFSTTLQTAPYLQALHPEHEFTFLPVGQRIKSYEKDFSPVRDALTDAGACTLLLPRLHVHCPLSAAPPNRTD